MNPTLKNILAVVVGLMIGSIVNMIIVVLGGSIIAPPEGVDFRNMESIQASAHLFTAKHYLMPFLAHAIGTLVGALLAFKVAATKPARMSIIVGMFFLAGGIYGAIKIPAPIWFIILDLVVAYIPMAMLGAKLSGKKQIA